LTSRSPRSYHPAGRAEHLLTQKETTVKKASKKATSERKAKGKKSPLSGAALRDLELMNPAAKRVKGGRTIRRSPKG